MSTLNQLYLLKTPWKNMMMENLVVFGTPALPFPLEWWTSQVRDALII